LCGNGGCCDQNTGLCISGDAGTCPNGNGACLFGGCRGGTCGLLGQLRCPNGTDCTSPSTVDVNGRCVACGGAGQECCAAQGGDWCGLPYACNGNTNHCEHCGAAGELCCQGRFCDAGTCGAAVGGRCP
ncbi:MAG: hypothetical protein ACYC8T_34195, partial [Myxococcaceae bacterium]